MKTLAAILAVALLCTAAAAATPSLVNINTADAATLDTLPRVGPVIAKRIIDYRAAHGNFKTIDELDDVKGIGPKTLAKIRPKATV